MRRYNLFFFLVFFFYSSLTTVLANKANFINAPVNDLCLSATPIYCDTYNMVGTTTDATNNTPSDCYDFEDPNSGGVWYSFIGTGGQVTVNVNADPSGYDDDDQLNDSELAVYSGTCTQLTCVGGNDDAHFLTDASTVAFASVIGEQYYFYVNGHDNDDVGFFHITVTCSGVGNNDCSAAVTLNIGDTNIVGTTIGATESNSDGCQSTNTGSGGVWYKLTGDGTVVKITIDDTPGSTSDLGNAKMSVYTNSCTNLSCVTGGYSSVTVPTTNNADYWVYVSKSGNGEGNFRISVETILENNICENATELNIGDTNVAGSTTYATAYEETNYCISGDHDAKGVWYKVTGNGKTLLVTVNPEPGASDNLESVSIGVFEGSCSSLSCVSVDEYAPNSNSSERQLMFHTNMNEVYYVYIKGYDKYNHVGNFTISLADINIPSNDECTAAINLNGNNGAAGVPTVGQIGASTASATESGVFSYCGVSTPEDDVWFEYTTGSSNETLTVALSDIQPVYSVVMEVDTICDYSHRQAMYCARHETNLEIAALANTKYYIRVFYVSGGGATDPSHRFNFNIAASSVVLPAELITFEGEALEKINRLEWRTASEEDVDYFVVERSADSRGSWKELRRVAATGTSSQTQYYQCDDFNPLPNAYYRLKTIDVDAHQEISSVIRLKRAERDLGIVNISPNPTSGLVNVQYELTKGRQVNIMMTNILGEVVRQQIQSGRKGLNEYSADLDKLSSGIYFITLDDGLHKLVRRVVKN